MASVLGRLYLVSLKSHRKRLEQRQRTAKVDDQLESASTYSRADSRALAEMMKEAYPDLELNRPSQKNRRDEYQKRLSALKERLRCGRNWETLQADFTPAILLPIPIGEEYKIRDSE